jgi:hypothetical protein
MCIASERRGRYRPHVRKQQQASSSAKDELRAFLQKYLDQLGKRPSNLRRSSSATDWQIEARQSLRFAEQELDKGTPQSVINAVSHLKRAADWQLEKFLEYYNLRPRKGNLSVPRKLQFLEDAGLFSARSLRRLNEIRNRLEHDFEHPNLPDLAIYYDLVQAFVSVIEYVTLIVPAAADSSSTIWEGVPGGSNQIGTFRFTYLPGIPAFESAWEAPDMTATHRITSDNYKDFAYFFRVYALLHRRYYDLAGDYIKTML